MTQADATTIAAAAPIAPIAPAAAALDAIEAFRAPLAHRRRQPLLTRATIAHLGGAIVVHVSADEPIPRPRAAEAAASRAALRDRVRRGRSLGPEVERWARAPYEAPRTLLGVAGAEREPWVCAAIAIDPCGWAAAAEAGRAFGRYDIPTSDDAESVNEPLLDHLGLRGRILRGGEISPAPEVDVITS